MTSTSTVFVLFFYLSFTFRKSGKCLNLALNFWLLFSQSFIYRRSLNLTSAFFGYISIMILILSGSAFQKLK